MKYILPIVICTFLWSCSSHVDQEKLAKKDSPKGYFEGLTLYNQTCAVCHGNTGEPKIASYPPLKNSDYLKNNQSKIACIIRHGIEKPLLVNNKEYKLKMVGFPKYSAQEISQLMTYINNSWGNDYGVISTEKVKTELDNCQ